MPPRWGRSPGRGGGPEDAVSPSMCSIVWQVEVPGAHTVTVTKAVFSALAGPPSMISGSTFGGPGLAITCAPPPPPPPPPPHPTDEEPPPPPPQALSNSSEARATFRALRIARHSFEVGRGRS